MILIFGFEVARELIFTFLPVYQRATVLDAKLVLEACEFYKKENQEAIQRLKGTYQGKRKRPQRRLPKKIVPQSPGTSNAAVPRQLRTFARKFWSRLGSQ